MALQPENAVDGIDQPVPGKSGQKSGYRKSGSNRKKKRKKHRSARVYMVLMMLTLVFVISISLAIGIIEIGKDMLGINGSQKLILFTIPEGATTAEIADMLREDGIIRIPKAFVYFSRLSKADASYVAGEHEISASMAYETLIDELQKNPNVEEAQKVVDVMFPEGISLYDAAMKLQENNICDASRFLYYFNAGGFGYEFENYLPATTSRLKFYTMEGYFFPDTYTFYEEMEPDAVCRKIYMNFDLKITDEDYARIEELNTTLDEVIILASMVQAEAANAEEMPEIASVFWNRLHYPENFGGGKLQSDPTSKYVTQVIKPNIELENQQIYDAYNTYVCVGLPAGAIGNPGMDAIQAVLYPSETNYFYFYANIDTGVTYFAETLEEHNANIEMVRQQQADAEAAAENPENTGEAQ
ncbi:MAG: endolytic transglycosylase MltG [Oscillospiraceae bacterium]|nr:endolytic transglycosylase MltG [Oscillospiraceae bacterium]